MRAARFVTLILTAHGSADPRSAASADELARTIRRVRRDVDVRVAFCEQNSPNLVDVLASAGPDAVVVPLLLAYAYHARVDIPAMIDASGYGARQADVLWSTLSRPSTSSAAFGFRWSDRAWATT